MFVQQGVLAGLRDKKDKLLSKLYKRRLELDFRNPPLDAKRGAGGFGDVDWLNASAAVQAWVAVDLLDHKPQTAHSLDARTPNTEKTARRSSPCPL